MENGKILIIDDNRSVLSALELLLEDKFSDIKYLASPNELPRLLESGDIDLILLDMNFKAGINTCNEGIYWLREILKYDPDISVIMITAYGDVELAVKAIREGAVDFVLKPWDNEKLLATLHSALKLRKSRKEVNKLRTEQKSLKRSFSGSPHKTIVGSSPAVADMMRIIEKIAATDAAVLITGENGTGKDLVANEIHKRSKRNKEVMITVDMGAITETLFESELFGHVKGSFTDAREDRAGKIEAASGGTLCLDEIGNLSLSLQSKLLNALESMRITKVGSNRPIPVDIRLICVTNRDLNEMVREGLFREDLLYRINTIHIEVPPLRGRKSDIPVLSEFFLRKFSEKYAKPSVKLTSQSLEILSAYDWPGNIRELQHTIEKAVILSEGSNIKPEDLMLKYSPGEIFEIPDKTLDDMEKQMIITSLRENKGNKSAAAEKLGITRQKLYNRIKKYGL
ncbi:MAG TPA: sigma-54-dependent Fis family transcriptional regulator [Bacteroidales bacterium]|nr:sigma-54-dependent Fis family transcriptional regulator [Bacteroidales bacterium]